jgi:predicted MFS family arabinose efflux permease
MVLGGGTIADLIPKHQRGTAMAIWMMGLSMCWDILIAYPSDVVQDMS